VDPARAANTLHDRVGTAGLTTGSVIVPRKVADPLEVRAGDALQLTADGRSVPLRAVVTDLRRDTVLVTPGDLRTVLPQAGPATLWLRLDPAADVLATVNSLKETVVTVTGSSSSVPVTGMTVERAAYEQAIRTLLLIVTGLLAVAVAIA
jgi:putative ABC transport system permease protein